MDGFLSKKCTPIADIEIALGRMLETLKKHQKKVLITIDEAVNTKDMRTFISAFQIMIRNDLPVFLLMTGLYENISDLQNEKSLTFLYRAPKIEMKPLSLRTIAENYRRNLPVTEEEASAMAKMTRGYAFAFQALGFFTYEKGEWNEDVLREVQEYLEEYAYEKIWMELSQKDRYVSYGIACSEDGRISGIRSFLNMDTNQFNPYRMRLIRKGIVSGEKYGFLKFTLPLFEQYAADTYEAEHDPFEL